MVIDQALCKSTGEFTRGMDRNGNSIRIQVRKTHCSFHNGACHQGDSCHPGDWCYSLYQGPLNEQNPENEHIRRGCIGLAYMI